MHFDELQLIDPLLRAVQAEGYTDPSLIQSQAIPHVLAGHDLLGCAQTGTGKTAAFALPILQRLSAHPTQGARYLRALVLSPTRELASQIGESFDAYGRFTSLRQVTVYGGVNQKPQVDHLRRGADILVATPGRLLDLIGQGHIRLDRLEVLVLDEADRMLDMGFIHDVRRIVAKLPAQRQTLLFSATMPEEIRDLADDLLRDPIYVAVTPAASTVETIQQSIYFVEKSDKPALLEHLLRDRAMKRVLIFTRTKHGANKVARQLERASVSAEAIHGNKSQGARERALANFKAGQTRVLVATDIAARGIDVDDISHVINYDLPNEPESYVHRIGRTGRAGASGMAYSLCDTNERAFLVDIERLIQMHIPPAADYPYASALGLPARTDLKPIRKSGNGQSAPKAQAPRSAERDGGSRQGPSNGPRRRGGWGRNRRRDSAASGSRKPFDRSAAGR
ncbi:MAG: DEAD/DEAH box helicase [Chloroflexi bacterium]|nr:MAG: DEAD/DEAH box helicase [Chloroflexota bacterium]